MHVVCNFSGRVEQLRAPLSVSKGRVVSPNLWSLDSHTDQKKRKKLKDLWITCLFGKEMHLSSNVKWPNIGNTIFFGCRNQHIFMLELSWKDASGKPSCSSLSAPVIWNPTAYLVPAFIIIKIYGFGGNALFDLWKIIIGTYCWNILIKLEHTESCWKILNDWRKYN